MNHDKVTAVTYHRTTDGKDFSDFTEARLHQATLDALEAVNRYLERVSQQHTERGLQGLRTRLVDYEVWRRVSQEGDE